MKASELVDVLESLENKFGDHEVMLEDRNGEPVDFVDYDPVDEVFIAEE